MSKPELETPAKNLTERTFGGFLWMILGSGVQVVLKVTVLAILARLVTPAEFGVMGIAIMLVDFSKIFTHMGVGPAIVQRKELEDRHISTGFTLSICMGVFFAGTLVLFAPLLASFFRMEKLTIVLRAISLVFLIDSLTLIAQALLHRNMKFKVIVSVELASYLFGYAAVGITTGYLGWGVWALVAANLAQALLFTILLGFVQPWPKKIGLDPSAFKELIFFGGGMTLAKVGNFIANQGDNLIIGRTLGAGALGIYGRAYQFMVMPASLFGSALDKALFPAMSKVQGEKEKLAKAFLTCVSLIALLALPISFLIVLLAPEIVMVLLGPDWLDVILPLQILACSLLFRMSYKMSDSLARATGSVYSRAWRQWIFASAVLIGSYVGQFWGLHGVAMGVALALVLNFLLMGQLSLSITGVTWMEMFKAHKLAVIWSLVSATAGYLLVTLCRAYSIPQFLTLIVTMVGAAVPMLVAAKYFPSLLVNDDLKKLFDEMILKKLKKTKQ